MRMVLGQFWLEVGPGYEGLVETTEVSGIVRVQLDGQSRADFEFLR